MLKNIRTRKCLSQQELASISNVSIKTIQRIENGHSMGSSYSIKQLANALNIEPIDLRHQDSSMIPDRQKAQSIIKLINWSALAVVIIPLANIIVPLIILHNSKDKETVCRIGKKIVSVQILWTFSSLALTSFLPLLYLSLKDQTYAGSVPIFIPIYLLTVFVDVVIILTIAFQLSNKNDNEFWMPNLL